MTSRSFVTVFIVIGIGSLLLLADSTITGIVPEMLDLRPERAFQSRVVYGFGALGAAFGMILLTFFDYDEFSEPRQR